MSKFEKMIKVLEQISEDLKPEIKKAYEIDNALQEVLEDASNSVSHAAAYLKDARQRIAQIKRQASAITEQFPDEK